MLKRFTRRTMSSRVTFIEALSKTSSLLSFYDPESQESNRGVVGCFASHLKAIRTFLETDEEEAIICEDDVLPHNDFIRKYSKVRDNFPSGTPLVCLSYFSSRWEEHEWSGKKPEKKNLLNHAERIFGTQMYWISRFYALEVLSRYDRPRFGFSLWEGEKTSELITMQSGGLLGYPPLAIEDCIDSDIRDENQINQYHNPSFVQWIYSRYCLGSEGSNYLEETPLSAIASDILKRCQILNDNTRALRDLYPVYRDIRRGRSTYDVSQIEEFLSSFYVSAFYTDRELAVAIARYYIKLTQCWDDFLNIFQQKESYIRTNFDYLEIDLWSSGGGTEDKNTEVSSPDHSLNQENGVSS